MRRTLRNTEQRKGGRSLSQWILCLLDFIVERHLLWKSSEYEESNSVRECRAIIRGTVIDRQLSWMKSGNHWKSDKQERGQGHALKCYCKWIATREDFWNSELRRGRQSSCAPQSRLFCSRSPTENVHCSRGWSHTLEVKRQRAVLVNKSTLEMWMEYLQTGSYCWTGLSNNNDRSKVR